MLQAKSVVREKNKNNPYLFINLVFAFFPISFVLGSFIVNLNALLLCCLGIFYLKSKILKTKFDFSIKIIFLFFLIIFFSTSLSFAKILYFAEYDSIHLNIHLIRLMKSIVFFRYFLLLIIIYLLSKFNILNFKYFFLTAAVSSILVSLDLIYQYIFGFNIIGLKSFGSRNSGFFGDEFIAGAYVQRFAFFAIFFTIFIFKNKNYIKFISSAIVVCILGVGILVSGNKMPLILFIFGLFIVFFSNLKIKKIFLVSLVALFTLLTFIFSSNEHLKNKYSAFFNHADNIITMEMAKDTTIGIKTLEKEQQIRNLVSGDRIVWESYHRRLFLTALDTWRLNKIFGGGIRSFIEDCFKLREQPDININEDIYPGKRNRLCSNHPHNYYLQILTETGIVGIFITLIIGFLFIGFIFKNLKFIKQINVENFILFSTIISLILETFPLRSAGSLFTTNNATYVILIGSILLSYKELLKIKIE